MLVNDTGSVPVRLRGWPKVGDAEWSVKYSALGLPKDFSVPKEGKRRPNRNYTHTAMPKR